MDWTQLDAILRNLYVTTSVDSNFDTELPDVINYAENRIYRDLDFLQTRKSQAAPALTPGSRAVSLAGLTYPVIVLEQVNIITPISTAADLGTRHPLTRNSKPWMDLMYSVGGVPASPTVPTDFAMTDEEDIIVGPVSDAAYGVEVTGTFRPEQISATNPTTWLCDNLPELYVAACMIRLSGYAKNYAGATSDDPQQPVSWGSEYDKLLKSADVEEARRKAQSASWSDQKPLATSTPARA